MVDKIEYGGMATNIEELQDITQRTKESSDWWRASQDAKARLTGGKAPAGFVGMSTEKGTVFVPIINQSKQSWVKGKTPIPKSTQNILEDQQKSFKSPNYTSTMSIQEQKKLKARQDLFKKRAELSQRISQSRSMTPTMDATIIQTGFGEPSRRSFVSAPSVGVRLESDLQKNLRQQQEILKDLPLQKMYEDQRFAKWRMTDLYQYGASVGLDGLSRRERVKLFATGVGITASQLDIFNAIGIKAGLMNYGFGATTIKSAFYGSTVTQLLASDPLNPNYGEIILLSGLGTMGAISLWKEITAFKQMNTLVKVDKLSTLKQTDLMTLEKGSVGVSAKILGQNELGRLLKVPSQELYNFEGLGTLKGITEGGKGIVEVSGKLFDISDDVAKVRFGQRISFELSDDQIKTLSSGGQIDFYSSIRSEMDVNIGKEIRILDTDSTGLNKLRQITLENDNIKKIESIGSTKILDKFIVSDKGLRFMSLADDIRLDSIRTPEIKFEDITGFSKGITSTIDDFSLGKTTTILIKQKDILPSSGGLGLGETVIKTGGEVVTTNLERTLSKGLETAFKSEVIKGTANQPVINLGVGNIGVSVKGSDLKEKDLVISDSKLADIQINEMSLDTRQSTKLLYGTKQRESQINKIDSLTISDSAFQLKEKQSIGNIQNLNLGQIGKLTSEQELKTSFKTSINVDIPTNIGSLGLTTLNPEIDLGLPDARDLLPSVRDSPTPSYRGKRKSRYTPTFSAIEFNISLEVPRGFNERNILGSGLDIRPILRTRKGVKKKMAKKGRKKKSGRKKKRRK